MSHRPSCQGRVGSICKSTKSVIPFRNDSDHKTKVPFFLALAKLFVLCQRVFFTLIVRNFIRHCLDVVCEAKDTIHIPRSLSPQPVSFSNLFNDFRTSDFFGHSMKVNRNSTLKPYLQDGRLGSVIGSDTGCCHATGSLGYSEG